MDPEKVKAALEAIKNGDADAALEILEEMVAAAAGAPAEESTPAEEPTPAEEALAENPDPEPEEEEMIATALMRLTATASAGEALADVTRLIAQRDATAQERDALELSARRDLIAELVKLGVEFPATAWVGNAADRNPVKRLADEPIADLRARVALHRKTPRAPTAPPRDQGVKALSANELAACKKRGIDPSEFAARKAAAVRRSA